SHCRISARCRLVPRSVSTRSGPCSTTTLAAPSGCRRAAAPPEHPPGAATYNQWMSALTEAAVLDALRSVRDPDLHKDVVVLGFVKNLRIDSGHVAFTIELTTPACPVKDLMRDQAHAAVSALPGVTQ